MSKLQEPFRYDYVGSFLRTEELKKATTQYNENKITKEVSVIKKENVALLNVAYDMDRVVAVLGENKVKEAIEVAKHLEQANAKRKSKKRCIDRDCR